VFFVLTTMRAPDSAYLLSCYSCRVSTSKYSVSLLNLRFLHRWLWRSSSVSKRNWNRRPIKAEPHSDCRMFLRVSCSVYSPTLKMGTVYSCETPYILLIARPYTPEYRTLMSWISLPGGCWTLLVDPSIAFSLI
jgi:hypothetical protein